MILFCPPEDWEEEEEGVAQERVPKKVEKRWKYMAPVWDQKKPEELEGSEEEADEGEEEEKEIDLGAPGLTLKVSTPSLTIEFSIAGKKPSKKLLHEAEQFYERILRISRQFRIL